MRYLSILLFLLATSVFARDLPAEGVPAELGAVDYPYVRLAGKAVRLAPGARIFDEAGRIVPPNTFTGRVPVVYTLDARGDVQEIWILTGEEIAGLKSRKKRQ